MTVPFVLKMGGSLLTRHGRPFEVAEENMRGLAAELAAGVPAEGLVVVVGSGSSGRGLLPVFSSGRIERRHSHLARRVIGLLSELHERLADALDSAGLPVSPLHAGTLFAVERGRVAGLASEILSAHLTAGRVPLVNGGIVPDLDGDFTIVSSDRMAAEIAAALGARKVIWATDVDGVLDRNGRLMPLVERATAHRMWDPAEAADDPTGAMGGKVAQALELAGRGIESFIVNGTSPGRLRAALRGEQVTGTCIHRVAALSGDRYRLEEPQREENAVAMPISGTGNVSQGRRPYKESCMPLPELFTGPRIDRLNYTVYEDGGQAVAALKRGEADLVDFPLSGDGSDLGDDIAVDRCRDFGYYYVAFNNRKSPLDRKPFRKALAYLVDDVKRVVAASMQDDRVELMDSIMVQYYGRLVNRYVPKYETDGPDDAVTKALAQLNGASLDGIGDGEVRFLITSDDPIAQRIMAELKTRIERAPELARIFTFVEVPRNEVAAQVYAGDEGDWHVYAGWQYVQDNLSRWNPGMSKLRLSLDWTADFQSGNSRTRNYPGFSNADYDRVAQQFLTTLHPRDLRGAVITEEHLEPWWNNAQFWEKGGDLPEDADALLLLWKLQWMVADEVPVVPLFARTVRFVRRADVEGIWNGDPDESFTYPGGNQPIESTYPGGTMSYWTFQRVHRSDSSNREINLAVSNPLRHINPLGVGNYWDALVWSRLYESMLGLNPFLLMKGVAEDTVNLADSYRSEFFSSGTIRYGLHFTVQPGVKWHDGTDFTANDVAFTYLSMMGARGRQTAAQHPTTKGLASALVNDEPIPAWVDMTHWLEHVEVPDDKSISLYFTHSSRYLHEWFGDMPIIPMHVWRHLGSDFTRPVYKGIEGLYAIRDDALGAPDGDYCGWHGLVGTGPFVWQGSDDPLNGGGSLTAFADYHNKPASER